MSMNEMFNDTMGKRMSRAVAGILMSEKFYGTHLAALPLIQDESIQTMCTNGVCIKYSPQFANDHANHELETSIMHEVLHVVLKHHLRKPDWLTDEEWNVCVDYEVNILLYDAGRKLPDGVLLDEQYRGMSAERIARILHKNRKPDNDGQGTPDEQDGQGQDDEQDKTPSDGDGDGDGDEQDSGDSGDSDDSDTDDGQDGSGDSGDSGDSDDSDTDDGQDGQDGSGDSDASPAPFGDESLRGRADMGKVEQGTPDDPTVIDTKDWKKEEESKIDVRTEQAIKIQHKSDAAKGEAFATMVDTQLGKPLDWYSIMSSKLTALTKTDYSYRKPNRRYPNSIVPTLANYDLIECSAVIDTSISMTDPEFQLIIGRLDDLLTEFPRVRINIIHADDAVRYQDEYTAMDVPLQVKMHGGNCTDFVPAFKCIEEDYENTAVVIYFTDMCPRHWNFAEHEPNCDVIWVDTQSFHTIEMWERVVPFGEVVQLEK